MIQKKIIFILCAYSISLSASCPEQLKKVPYHVTRLPSGILITTPQNPDDIKEMRGCLQLARQVYRPVEKKIDQELLSGKKPSISYMVNTDGTFQKSDIQSFLFNPVAVENMPPCLFIHNQHLQMETPSTFALIKFGIRSLAQRLCGSKNKK